MGNLAVQEIKGFIKIVSSLSFSSAIVRVAIIAGTLHPKPNISGIKALPGRPMLCISLSITNAALAI